MPFNVNEVPKTVPQLPDAAMSIEVLQGSDDWDQRKREMLALLKSLGWHTLLLSETDRQPRDQSDSEVGQLFQQGAMAAIRSRLGPEPRQAVESSRSANQLWNILSNHYAPIDTRQFSSIFKRYHGVKLAGQKSMDAYLEVHAECFTKLSNIHPSFAVPEAWRVELLLLGLKPEYRPFIQQFHGKHPTFTSDGELHADAATFDIAAAELREWEAQLQRKGHDRATQWQHKIEHSNMTKDVRKPRTNAKLCQRCREVGKTLEECIAEHPLRRMTKEKKQQNLERQNQWRTMPGPENEWAARQMQEPENQWAAKQYNMTSDEESEAELDDETTDSALAGLGAARLGGSMSRGNGYPSLSGIRPQERANASSLRKRPNQQQPSRQHSKRQRYEDEAKEMRMHGVMHAGLRHHKQEEE